MTRKYENLLCSTIAALMWGPKTQAQLVGHVSDHRTSVANVIRRLRHYGLIYRHGSVKPEMDANGNHKSGKYPVLWALNTTPFGNADRVTPHGTAICQPQTTSDNFGPRYSKPCTGAPGSTAKARPTLPASSPATSCALAR